MPMQVVYLSTCTITYILDIAITKRVLHSVGTPVASDEVDNLEGAPSMPLSTSSMAVV
jgi:hypothetical protein